MTANSSARLLLHLDDATIGGLLTWPMAIAAVEQALQSVCGDQSPDLPQSVQNPRTATVLPDKSGALLTMPGFISNYTALTTAPNPSLPPAPRSKTLGCKLVTSFPRNQHLHPPQPAIAATIALFHPETGHIVAILDGTRITTWRTVAASIVATRLLWFQRHFGPQLAAAASPLPTLAIVGCGVQGRAHALGMAATYALGAIRLWNRTGAKADAVLADLRLTYPALQALVVATVEECVREADIIVVATYAAEPLIRGEWLRRGAHINAVGAGPGNHHSELADSVYERSVIWVDSLQSAAVELATLGHPVAGAVGQLSVGGGGMPGTEELTVFHSMGMAVEDCAVAQAVLDTYNAGRT